MSRGLNVVHLIGNVGAEPEVRTTASGVKVAKFSLATNRTWRDKGGEQQEKTEWHRITAWDKLAGIVEEYVGKGHRIYIEGRLEYSQSEHEGVTKFWTDIIASQLIMLGGKDGEKPRERTGARSSGPSPFDDEEDLPY